MRSLILTAVLVAPVACPGESTAQPVVLSAEQWRDDLIQARAAIRETHPMPAAELDARGFPAAMDQLLSAVAGRSDQAIVLGLAAAVARLGDGHSRVTLPLADPAAGHSDAHSETLPPEDPRLALERLPLAVEAFDDGYFVVRATAARKGLLGHRLVAIDGIEVAEAAARVAALAHGENDGWRQRIVADRLTLPAVLRFVGIATGDAIGLTLDAPDGSRTDVALRAAAVPAEWRALPMAVSLRTSNREQPYWFEVLPEHRSLYVNYRRAAFDLDRPPMVFARELLAAAEANRTQRLVLDLRDNTGGNASWNQPLLEAILGHPVFDRPGGLYVLTGPDTFSAAMLLANELEQHSHALFVGSPTGSSPDHYGDARKVRLANSGITIRISTLRWKNWLAGEFRDAITPQVPVPRRFADQLAGRDPALVAALTHSSGDQPVDQFRELLETVDVNAAAIYLARLAVDPRHGEDMERQLVDLGRAYREADEITRSRYTLLLAETYYSHSPTVLFEYGRTLEAAGRLDQAAEAYRRTLARDPAHAGARTGLGRLAAP